MFTFPPANLERRPFVSQDNATFQSVKSGGEQATLACGVVGRASSRAFRHWFDMARGDARPTTSRRSSVQPAMMRRTSGCFTPALGYLLPAMRDLTSPRLIKLKGLMFLVVGILAALLLILEQPTLKVAVLLAISVWCFCRFYYCAFYVIEHYVDSRYRFSGLWSFARYLMQKNGGNQPPERAGNFARRGIRKAKSAKGINRRSICAGFDVRRSMLDVRCFLFFAHFAFFVPFARNSPHISTKTGSPGAAVFAGTFR